MAITVETQPDAHHSVYHKVIYEASSTIASNNEFKFVFKFIGFPTTRIIKVSPRPGDGWGFLDASRHLKDLINIELFDIEEPSLQLAPFASYTLQIDEEYKDMAGDLVTIPGVSTAGVALSFILSRNDILTYEQNKHLLIDSDSEMLWSIPNKTKVQNDDIFFIHTAITGTSQVVKFLVKEFFNNGTTNTISTTMTLGRANYVTLDLASVLTDPSVTTHIEVKFQTITSVDICAPKILILEDECTIFKRHKIIFLDSKGSYSCLNFNYASKEDLEVSAKTYEKFVNGAVEVGTSRHLTRFFTESSEVFTVNTGNLTDKHNVLLQDLIKSINVFLDVRNDERFPSDEIKFVPIEILTDKLSLLKSDNQEINQQKIRFRFSYNDITR